MSYRSFHNLIWDSDNNNRKIDHCCNNQNHSFVLWTIQMEIACLPLHLLQKYNPQANSVMTLNYEAWRRICSSTPLASFSLKYILKTIQMEVACLPLHLLQKYNPQANSVMTLNNEAWRHICSSTPLVSFSLKCILKKK
jgi:hypothetical protein